MCQRAVEKPKHGVPTPGPLPAHCVIYHVLCALGGALKVGDLEGNLGTKESPYTKCGGWKLEGQARSGHQRRRRALLSSTMR